MAQQSPVGQGLLIIEASQSHSEAPQPVRLLWTSDQPTQRPLPNNTQQSQDKISMNSAGFEPAIRATERPQTSDLDRAAIGTNGLNSIPKVSTIVTKLGLCYKSTD